MIIGHTPAGYITAKKVLERLSLAPALHRKFILASILGALAPDSDILYFYLIAHRQNHHHSYPTHFPIVWFSILAVTLMYYKIARKKYHAGLALIFAFSGSVHIMLDTVAGSIRWLAPFSDKPYTVFTVPALYKPWWLNFILHWSFLSELFLFVWAIAIFKRHPDISSDRTG